MSNSDSTANLYGNPFSYLSARVKDKRSSGTPIGDDVTSGAEDDGQEERKQPFSYLKGSSPDEEPSRGAGDGSDKGDNDVFPASEVTNKPPNNERQFNFENAYDPPPPNHAMDRSYSTLGGEGRSPRGFSGQQNPGYEASDNTQQQAYTSLGHIPGATNAQGNPMYYSGEYPPHNDDHGDHADPNNMHGEYHQQAQGNDYPTHKIGESDLMRSGYNKPTRPSTRDSALHSSYRSNSQYDGDDKKAFSCCCMVVVIVVTAVVCLAIGFVVGWFVYQMAMVVPISEVVSNTAITQTNPMTTLPSVTTKTTYPSTTTTYTTTTTEIPTQSSTASAAITPVPTETTTSPKLTSAAQTNTTAPPDNS